MTFHNQPGLWPTCQIMASGRKQGRALPGDVCHGRTAAEHAGGAICAGRAMRLALAAGRGGHTHLAHARCAADLDHLAELVCQSTGRHEGLKRQCEHAKHQKTPAEPGLPQVFRMQSSITRQHAAPVASVVRRSNWPAGNAGALTFVRSAAAGFCPGGKPLAAFCHPGGTILVSRWNMADAWHRVENRSVRRS